jgi:hypothetical protein
MAASTNFIATTSHAEAEVGTNNYVLMANSYVNYQTLGGNLDSAPKTGDSVLTSLTARGGCLLSS